jgi:hypothetical protein
MSDVAKTPVTITVKETKNPKDGTTVTKTTSVADAKKGIELKKLEPIKNNKAGTTIEKFATPKGVK